MGLQSWQVVDEKSMRREVDLKFKKKEKKKKENEFQSEHRQRVERVFLGIVVALGRSSNSVKSVLGWHLGKLGVCEVHNVETTIAIGLKNKSFGIFHDGLF